MKYDSNKEVNVDIGFMVFNQKTYPNLINFFLENNIQIEKSDISAEIKSKIMDLRIDCISSKIEIDIGLVLIWIISFGFWAYLSKYRIQEKRKFSLLDLKGQVSGLSSFILLDT